MPEWNVDRLDLTEHVSEGVVEERILAEVRARKDLSAKEQSIVAEYLRGLAAGVDPEDSEPNQLED